MLPMKTRILEYAIQRDAGIGVDEFMSVLRPDYGTERMFSRKQVEEYLYSLLGVGFLDAEKVELDTQGDLKVTYHVTSYGKSRKKYL